MAEGVLTLYQAEWCPFSSAVREVLTELGIDFLARQVDLAKHDLDNQDSRLAAFKKQYMGQLPGDEDNTVKLLAGLNSQLDAYTQAQLEVELRPYRSHPWMAVAGLALTWKHVGLLVAGGYGNVFIPGANVAVPNKGFVPDASLWVTF